MKNVFIIHSYNGDTEYSFAPSVEKLCKENNIAYYFPKFPIRSEATYESWENILKSFQPTDQEYNMCKMLIDNIYSIYSDNDEMNSIDKLEKYAEKLSANKIFIKGAGHFNPKSNITEIEKINEIILGE